jgi:3-hydroxy-9,10-secoandrosta-1,3,5(10)-triene-9,17-dione monooxygenase reductase component
MTEKFSGHVRGPKSDDELIQDAMHELPYGIYVIGSARGDRPNAMIADWVMQVSFSPRLVAVAFERDSTNLANIRANNGLTINLLDDDSMQLARAFVQPTSGAKVQGRSDEAAAVQHDKLAGIDYRRDARGCPILDDALVWIEAEAEQFIEAGDHIIVVARVLNAAVEGSSDPLTSVITGWSYSG